jgi:hypothetical protein
MASNIKYPEDHAMWFIEGDKLALVTDVDSSGNTISSSRKKFKAIRESVTDGILIVYNAEPNNVSAITDTPDVDNSMHHPLVEYVKRCLYMDRAGSASDPNSSAVAIQMANFHNQKWVEATRKFGIKKRDKVGGTRSVVPADLR